MRRSGIFFPNNPLHDGGVIIQGDKISCAGAVVPTSNSLKINKRLGTRHRAALGISEETDAIAIVVSEETGKISIAYKGEIERGFDTDTLRERMKQILLSTEEENKTRRRWKGRSRAKK